MNNRAATIRTAMTRTAMTRTAMTRTGAVARYLAADALRAQRVLVPVVLYAIVLGLLLAQPPGPPPGVWPVSALALYATTAWVAVALAGAEEPEQRTVTVAAAGGPGRVAIGMLLVALAAGAVLVTVTVLVTAMRATSPYPVAALLAGALAHVAAATTGTAVGLLCGRPLLDRAAWSFGLAVTVVTVTAVQPWLPPVGRAVRDLEAGGAPRGSALLGLALCAAATAVSAAVQRRR